MNDEAIAIVSGAASGIGAASARRLCAAGFHVVLTDTNIDLLSQLHDSLEDIGGSTTLMPLDVRDQADWEKVELYLKSEFGRLDACVLAAGIGNYQTIFDIDADQWSDAVAVNLNGVAYGIRTAGRLMRDLHSPGAIVAVSSIMAVRGAPGYGAYSATKGAVSALVRCAALELGPFGVRINTVSPGNIDTPMLRNSMARVTASWGEAADLLGAKIPAGYVGEADDIANAIFALIDPQLKYVNGTDFVVDGGLIAGA